MFKNWINNSKYDYDLDNLILLCFNKEHEISTTDYYKSLRRLGYDYERLSKIKNKNFYKELNYKKFINNALNHLMYEYEKEQKNYKEKSNTNWRDFDIFNRYYKKRKR